MRHKGYMSIEAALVFPVVLMAVLLMMGMSFYVYDRIIVKECIYDALLLGAKEDYLNEEGYSNKEELMRDRVSTLLNERGLSLEVDNIKTHEGLSSVKIRVDANVNIVWITTTSLPIHIEEDLIKLDVIKIKRLTKLGKKLVTE